MAVVGAVILVGWGLRLHNLAHWSLWVDEGFSYEVARQGPPAILQILPVEDRHPPLHYLLLWATMQLAGRSEFSLRFLSVAAALLTLPLLYRLGRRLGGTGVGLLATAWLAISPFHIYYAQEARMYALLTLCGAASFLLWLQLMAGGGRRVWAGYVLSTAAALYSQYYAVFLLPAQALAAALGGAWRHRWRSLLFGLAAAALLFSPWLPTIRSQSGRQAAGYVPELGLQDVLWNLVTFYTLGEFGWPATAAMVGVVVVLALGVPPTWRSPGEKAPAARTARSAVSEPCGRLHRSAGLVLLGWLLSTPILAYTLSWLFAYEIRATGRVYYLVGLLPFLLLLARGLFWLEGAARWLLRQWVFRDAVPKGTGSPGASWNTAKPPMRLRNLGILAVGVPWLAAAGLAVAAWAEAPYLYDQYEIHPKEDFRAAAAYVEANSWPVDTIILDAEYIFRPFSYYYTGPLTWHRAIPDPERLEAALTAQLAGSRRAWLILSHDEQADPQANVQRWFRQNATLVDETYFQGVHVQLYELEPRPNWTRPAVAVPDGGGFGEAVALAGIDRPAGVEGGAPLRLTLTWQALRPLRGDYHAALLLTDAEGRVWTQVDRAPVSPFYPPQRWQPGEFLTDRYVLPTPEGLPPGEYALKLKFYDAPTGRALPASEGGELLTLGTVAVASARPAALRAGVDLAPELRLVEASFDPLGARPGDDLHIDLLWQALAPPAGRRIVVRLADPGGKPVVEQVVAAGEGVYPLERWQPHELVRQRPVLKLPQTLPPGRYHVSIGVEQFQEIWTLEIQEIPRRFDVPAISHPQRARLGEAVTLLGYDLSNSRVAPGDLLHLALYWQATGVPAADYTVFTHLIGPDGKIYAQRDNPPVDGTRPTGGWLPGEVLRDEYRLPLDPAAPAGDYYLEIGMYLPATGQRLRAGGDNAVVLSERIRVESRP